MRPEADDTALVFDMVRFGRKAVAAVSGCTFEGFLADEILRLAVERLVEIVGEAARNISVEFEQEHPEIPWHLVRAQRHILAHDYGDIIPDKIWRVATVHMPALIDQLLPLLPPSPADPEPDVPSRGF